MAVVVVTMKVMPDSPEADLDKITESIKAIIQKYAGDVEMRIEQVPIAFGLKQLDVKFPVEEEKEATDIIEEEVGKIEHVNLSQIQDVRRALG